MATTYWFERFFPIIIFLAASLCFFLWLLGLFCIWRILWSFGFHPNIWIMIESLSTALAAMTFIGTIFFAYREFEEFSRNRYLEIIDRLFNELNSQENIEARRWIFKNLPDEKIEDAVNSLSQEGQNAIKKVLNSLDRVAFIMQSNWIQEKTIMPWMNPMIVKSWMKLKPYVEYESHRRNEPDYYQNARRLGQHCIEWRSRNLPDSKITWINHAL